MSKRQQSPRNLAALALSLLVSVFSLPDANAQGWGYSPLTGSNSWLWMSRSFFSPAGMLFRGGYGYNAPYYIANTLAWNAAYGASQGINLAGRNAAIKRYNSQVNGINAPVMDQVSVAPWYYPPRGTQLSPAQLSSAVAPSTATATANVAATMQDPFADPKGGQFMPVPSSLPDASASAGSIAGAGKDLPAPAPDFKGAAQPSPPPQARALKQTQSEQGQKSKDSNPFAQAFVDHVNDNYSGDISRALSDKQTRGYAHALGILESSKEFQELPQDRIELIKRILQDPTEDSLTKVNTIRLLIKH